MHAARGAELWHLIHALLSNPESAFHAAMAGWKHPLSFGGMALYDLYDLQHQSKSKKKVEPYPRPWPDPSKKTSVGTSVSAVEALALLRPTP